MNEKRKQNKSRILNDKNLTWLLNYLNDPKINLIVLFGSYLKSKTKAGDIDILMIGSKFKYINFHRRSELFNIKSSNKYIDLFCYTEDEFKELFHSHLFVKNIKEDFETIKGDSSWINTMN